MEIFLVSEIEELNPHWIGNYIKVIVQNEIKEHQKNESRSFIKRQTSGTSSDNEWQRVTTSGTTSDNEWQRVTTNDNEWQRVVQQVIKSDNE